MEVVVIEEVQERGCPQLHAMIFWDILDFIAPYRIDYNLQQDLAQIAQLYAVVHERDRVAPDISFANGIPELQANDVAELEVDDIPELEADDIPELEADDILECEVHEEFYCTKVNDV